MKKVVGIVTLIIAVIGFTAAADAATLTFSLDELATWDVLWGDMTLDSGFTQVVSIPMLLSNLKHLNFKFFKSYGESR